MPQNYAEAVKWFRLAADQGDASAQYNLGVMYAKGQGCRRTTPRPEVVSPRRRPGRRRRADNLGVMYDNGQGVPQNYAEALKWYRLAADQGDANAQSISASCTTMARGCRRTTPRR